MIEIDLTQLKKMKVCFYICVLRACRGQAPVTRVYSECGVLVLICVTWCLTGTGTEEASG